MNNNFELEQISFGKILNFLIAKESITDIMIWENEIWITDIKKGHYKYNIDKHSSDEIIEFEQIQFRLPRQLAIRMQVSFNEGSPFIDGETNIKNKGQLRINAIHESMCSGDYPAIAIRKTLFSLRISEEKMLDEDYASKDFFDLFEVLIDAGCNVIIGGETGSGKTELLKYLSRYIRNNEAIITMEDTLETYLKRIYNNKNVLSLKVNNKYSFSDLLRSSLRQNPDWILVSETRSKEVIELLEAVSTGHKLISTIHTDGALSIPYRMVSMSKAQNGESERLLEDIFHNINIGIFIHYYNDNKGSHRRIAEVAEFYVGDDGYKRSHIIYRYDYKMQKYITNKIESSQIMMKILRKQSNTERIEGIFI